ncbi:MAG: hypothetical protein E7452_02455 [Ruminococcaceae bacterium]|nr:hypothetical protein [Oscillospiraceae bacterium]
MTSEQLCRALSETRPEFLEECEITMVTRPKKLHRGLLIAAVIMLLGCVSAMAVGISLRQSARNDMGIQPENPISEWTEYEATDGERVDLVSSFCSGGHVFAYLEVEDISAEDGAALEAETISWSLGDVFPHINNCSWVVSHVDYDAETETALVKAHIFGAVAENAEELTLILALERSADQKEFFKPVIVPVTESDIKTADVALSVENTDLGLTGSVKQVAVSAGTVEVTLQIQPAREWLADNGYEADDPCGLHDYFGSWFEAADVYLQDIRIGFADGSSMAVVDIPTPFAGNWIVENSALDPVETEGWLTLQHVFSQAQDLSAVTSVTIGGSSVALN